MLFPRRTWAIRVVEKLDLPIGSPEATVLISLLIWATKQDEKMMKSVGKTEPIADITITWACHMMRNASAATQLSKEAGVPVERAQQLLQDLRKAGRAVAVEHEMTLLVEKLDKLYPR